jgi:hypothetical protein
MPAVKNVGEPCAGEPHARFEVAAGGNQASPASTCRAAQAPLADPTNRHTVASRALLAGESIDEIAFLLGHRDANVTRTVYVRELADARRRTMRRSRMVAEFADVLAGTGAD